MTHCYGQRRRTRHKFRKGFKQHGSIHISRTLTTYKIDDIVDIIVDGSIHKGMPYKYYHGRTGRVFNVNPRSIGVIVNKQVRNRIIPKRIHVRIEHLRLSTCRKEFLNRIQANDKKKTEANKRGERISTKRGVTQPAGAIDIAEPKIQLLNPKLFIEIVWFSLFKFSENNNFHNIRYKSIIIDGSETDQNKMQILLIFPKRTIILTLMQN